MLVDSSEQIDTMNQNKIRYIIALVVITIGMLASSTVRFGFVVRAQDNSKTQKSKKDKKDQTSNADSKKEKRKVLNADEVKGRPVLWEDPGDIAGRDLFYGI